MKYILELDESPCTNDYGKDFYRCKQVPWWSVSNRIISKLPPYTEPDRKVIEDEVWEFATTCAKMDGADSVDVFGGYSLESFTKFSYQEAKDKYEEWLKQKDEIKVGDEVILMDTEYDTMIVTRTWKDDYWRECIDTVGFDGSICSFLKSKVKKTGRHFDEVEELLKKIGSEE